MTPVERVGRALAKEEGYAYDPLPYDARARAAIAAMWDPTEDMITAANNSEYECSEGISLDKLIERDGIRTVLRAAIAAALIPEPIDA